MKDRRALDVDYDRDPERFRAASAVPVLFGQGDVHADVAERFLKEAAVPVLDVGCGEGRLLRELSARGVRGVGCDSSGVMLAAVEAGGVLADALALPFSEAVFGGVAALYVLYHFNDPRAVLREVRRVVRAGGLIAVCAPSRFTDPELAAVAPEVPMTFDAELAPEMVGQHFQVVDIEAWDGPYVELRSREAIRLYLRSRAVPVDDIAQAEESLPCPLVVTKRGAVVWGRAL